MCGTCGCSAGPGAKLTDPDGHELLVKDLRDHPLVPGPVASPAHDHDLAGEFGHADPAGSVHDLRGLTQGSAANLSNAHEPFHGDGHFHGHAHPHPGQGESESASPSESHSHAHLHGHSHPHDHLHPHDHSHPHDHLHSHEHLHSHPHPHDHSHLHDESQLGARVDEPAEVDEEPDRPEMRAKHSSTTIRLEQDLLAKNSQLAERNRGWFAGRDILALNLVSSPGAGKTTLLERTIRDLNGSLELSVIEGDQETANDARRIRATGCRVIQINTGTGCHLDAAMLARALESLQPAMGSVLMIENVGNLVCPALFDLGERAKVLVASVTEGDDKPAKYPHMFRAAELVLLNKVDLLPYVTFDVARFSAIAHDVNPKIRILGVSATRGDGLDAWYRWLRQQAGQRMSLAVPQM